MKRAFIPFLSCWLALFLLHSNYSSAQYPLSSAAGGYGGLYSSFVNPAHLSYNWLPWGIHLPSAGIALQNNGLRADYFSGIAALFGRDYSVAIDNQASQRATNQADILIRNAGRAENAVRLQVWNQMLGGYLHWGYHSFGLGIGNRSFGHLGQISQNMLKHYTEGLLFDSLKNIAVSTDGLNFTAAAFTELQLAWSWRFLHHSNRSASIGLVVKPIFGYAGVQGRFDNLNYTVTDTDTFRINDFSGSYANAINQRYFQTPTGVGIDVGYEFVAVNPNGPNEKSRLRSRIDCTPFGGKLRKVLRPIPNHYWRFGVSILDFGAIQSNVRRYIGQANGLSASVLDPAFLNGQGAEPYFLNLIENQGVLMNDTMGFRIGLATAIGLQYDLWITNSFYLHASLIQRLPLLGDYSLQRLNQIMVAPRFESTWIEFGLPMSLYEYQHLQLGLWARLGPLTFGTDRLGELFGFRRLMGADAYVSLNVLPLWK